MIGELASYSGPAAQARATQANYTSNLYSIRVTVRSHRHGDRDFSSYSRELLPSQDYYAAGPGSELHTCFPCIAQMPPCRIYELVPTVRAWNRRTYRRYGTVGTGTLARHATTPQNFERCIKNSKSRPRPALARRRGGHTHARRGRGLRAAASST